MKEPKRKGRWREVLHQKNIKQCNYFSLQPNLLLATRGFFHAAWGTITEMSVNMVVGTATIGF